MDLYADAFALFAIFLPLGSTVIAALCLGRKTPTLTHVMTCLLMSLAVLSSYIMGFFVLTGIEQSFELTFFRWLPLEGFSVSWGCLIDPLSTVMIMVVNTVSTLVHLYSVGYMSHEKDQTRFMCYLSFFTFFMLFLVSSPNLAQIFVGWEGVGLCSYLLIGFYHHKKAANDAALKAFIVNRVGDIGFMIGLCAVFAFFHTLSFNELFEQIPAHLNRFFSFEPFGSVHLISFVCAAFFIGAVGKSAQIGLHTWLADAMEGPTPVSALIHAATMVTAGVFLMVRLSPLLEYAPLILDTIALFGMATAFFAATVACVQNDIKRSIAYSTCSQLGYMFIAVGCSQYSSAIFHLVTHAFFKALLFLSAGSVIHALSGLQDMREMGGLKRVVPFTFISMCVGSAALAGLPFFAGYYSKDAILEGAWATHTLIGQLGYIVGVLTALITAFYSWRLIMMTFMGSQKTSKNVLARAHESPFVMLFPLFILGLGAVFAGHLLSDTFLADPTFWGDALITATHQAHHLPQWVLYAPIVVGTAGTLFAFYYYTLWKKSKKETTLYRFLSAAWYFDALYDALFLRPLWCIGKFFDLWTEHQIIDRFIPRGIAQLVLSSSATLRTLHTGYVYHYAYAMLIGCVGLIGLYFLI